MVKRKNFDPSKMGLNSCLANICSTGETIWIGNLNELDLQPMYTT